MKIAEISKKLEISPDTLRYYERIGLIPGVGRSEGGIRDYSEEDFRWVEFIKCMRSAGLPIETLIEYVSLFQQGEKTFQARNELLIEQRELLKARIGDMNITLDRLDYKIANYEQTLGKAEKGLKEKRINLTMLD
jgi:MerR family transcriptional regulator, aldehyde-responsive regulator